MEKCWFVLRQTHYPAPEYKHESMAFGEAEGPVRLGHFIPGPKKIDNVINTGGVFPFPRDMRILRTEIADFCFSNRTEKGLELSGNASVPIASAIGMSIKAEAGVAFTRIMGSEWTVDHMETYIVQPTIHYLEQCRQSSELKAWIDKNKTLGAWKIYMISGLMVARGATRERHSTAKAQQGAGPGLDVPTSATLEVTTKVKDEREATITGQFKTDFVWAYRLSEVSTGIFDSDLSVKTVKPRGKLGSVMAPRPDDVDIVSVLAQEGLQDAQMFEIWNGTEQQFFVTIDGL
ncbi:hypothetical protein PFICI_11320 [Pestalotiopsis fici W106-1]|uniref:Uncharacterized protein n=1 Tax=Pestalotiopsis fici (strain W106-1 / CGMCC3.15140) TaxID=1229662 RepID=W3WX46_PESFW|nr:uncharacterized protein PFICI_11320 [Pestalotiopsis fici W106-1]ETS77446.1 hypothetical protein PFICI_11320 [Pestalotiopsis fici W106-1]